MTSKRIIQQFLRIFVAIFGMWTELPHYRQKKRLSLAKGVQYYSCFSFALNHQRERIFPSSLRKTAPILK